MADFTKHISGHGSSSSSSSSGSNSSSSSMDMDGMSMVFMTSTTTPLFSSHWTPATLGQYAGTCIFLIVLAFIFRFLLAWKHVQEHTWARRNTELNRLTIAMTTTPSIGDSMDEKEAQTQQVVTEKTVVAEGWGGRPWRFSTDLARAAMTTMITGVGYLLMLAVMTMNVGYFMSVLAGVFVGEVAWGRYILGAEH